MELKITSATEDSDWVTTADEYCPGSHGNTIFFDDMMLLETLQTIPNIPYLPPKPTLRSLLKSRASLSFDFKYRDSHFYGKKIGGNAGWFLIMRPGCSMNSKLINDANIEDQLLDDGFILTFPYLLCDYGNQSSMIFFHGIEVKKIHMKINFNAIIQTFKRSEAKTLNNSYSPMRTRVKICQKYVKIEYFTDNNRNKWEVKKLIIIDGHMSNKMILCQTIIFCKAYMSRKEYRKFILYKFRMYIPNLIIKDLTKKILTSNPFNFSLLHFNGVILSVIGLACLIVVIFVWCVLVRRMNLSIYRNRRRSLKKNSFKEHLVDNETVTNDYPIEDYEKNQLDSIMTNFKSNFEGMFHDLSPATKLKTPPLTPTTIRTTLRRKMSTTRRPRKIMEMKKEVKHSGKKFTKVKNVRKKLRKKTRKNIVKNKVNLINKKVDEKKNVKKKMDKMEKKKGKRIERKKKDNENIYKPMKILIIGMSVMGIIIVLIIIIVVVRKWRGSKKPKNFRNNNEKNKSSNNNNNMEEKKLLLKKTENEKFKRRLKIKKKSPFYHHLEKCCCCCCCGYYDSGRNNSIENRKKHEINEQNGGLIDIQMREIVTTEINDDSEESVIMEEDESLINQEQISGLFKEDQMFLKNVVDKYEAIQLDLQQVYRVHSSDDSLNPRSLLCHQNNSNNKKNQKNTNNNHMIHESRKKIQERIIKIMEHTKNYLSSAKSLNGKFVVRDGKYVLEGDDSNDYLMTIGDLSFLLSISLLVKCPKQHQNKIIEDNIEAISIANETETIGWNDVYERNRAYLENTETSTLGSMYSKNNISNSNQIRLIQDTNKTFPLTKFKFHKNLVNENSIDNISERKPNEENKETFLQNLFFMDLT
ncbi:hypothetical protein SNEBB_010438 [Seison nebaliae]|nr:hypothetical protein SNEBB_010438 [Seison nebaliae]